MGYSKLRLYTPTEVCPSRVPRGSDCPRGLEGIIKACLGGIGTNNIQGGIYKSVPGGSRYNMSLTRGAFTL